MEEGGLGAAEARGRAHDLVEDRLEPDARPAQRPEDVGDGFLLAPEVVTLADQLGDAGIGRSDVSHGGPRISLFDQASFAKP